MTFLINHEREEEAAFCYLVELGIHEDATYCDVCTASTMDGYWASKVI